MLALRQYLLALVLLLGTCAPAWAAPPPYRNFKVTVYIPVQVVKRMAHDPAWMRSSWRAISSRLHVNKVFIESYRAGVCATGAQLAFVKHFFVRHGVAVAGGMAMLAPGGDGQIETLDYALPKDRALARRMSALTARHFNEFILDDLYFFNTKSAADIAAKGNLSWAAYRMRTMDEVSRKLILGPAKAANPKVKVIIKFPNFYPSFPEMGFDLKREPKIFPEIWTGDETRYAPTTDQQLLPYESYEIFRYFENIAPGRDGGGWVDPIAMHYLDRYAEQLWDTILAKAPAINLFEYSNLLQPANPKNRAAWQYLPTTFNYFQMLKHCCGMPWMPGAKRPLLANVAAYALAKVDRIAGSLGKPVGLAVYRPLNTSGEDFLTEMLGMIGVPIEPYPYWPHAKTVLLTETARHVPHIVAQIAAHLRAGDNVIITSGLLRALQNHGFGQITATRVTHRTVAPTRYVAGFGFGAGTYIGHSRPILFPLIHFFTNGAWAVVRGIDEQNGVPLLLMDRYGKGVLYILDVPDERNAFYALPQRTLDALRGYLVRGLPVRLDGPAKVSVFEYNNGTFVVESYRNHPVAVRITGAFAQIRNLTNGVVSGGNPVRTVLPYAGAGAREYSYELRIEPHSFEAFRERS
jgi:hypothetical protein